MKFLQRLKDNRIMKRKVAGNTMSEIGSLFVMLFVVALLLLYIDYSRIILAKIEIDNLNRQYLLTAEMYGGLTDADRDAYYDNLRALGIEPTTAIVNEHLPLISELGQYVYGDAIEISYTIHFNSPIYARFHGTIFGIGIMSPTIDIPVYGKTISKW